MRLLKIYIFGAFLFVPFLHAQETFSIQGQVVRSEDTQPLPGAYLKIQSLNKIVVSDSKGKFTLNNLAPGEYWLDIVIIGYQKKRVFLEIEKAQNEKEFHVKLDSEPVVFEQITVLAERDLSKESDYFDTEVVNYAAEHDIPNLLGQYPGFSAIKRGGTAYDLVFRGFQKQRLNIQIDGGAHIYASCPNRMDPPTSHIQIDDLESIEVLRGPHSVRFGQGLGGVVNLAMKRPELYRPGVTLSAETGLNSNSDMRFGRLNVMGNINDFDFFLSGGSKEGEAYQDGDGRTVDAGYRINDYSMKLGWRLTQNQRMQIAWRQSFLRDAFFPALAQDAEYDDTNLAVFDYQWLPQTPTLRKLSVKLYQSVVDHKMTNKYRPERVSIASDAYTNTDGKGGKIEAELNVLGALAYIGGDFKYEKRVGHREIIRNMVEVNPLPMRFNIWPDVRQRQVGVFAQVEHRIQPLLGLTLAARLDGYENEARDPDSYFLHFYSDDLSSSEVLPTMSAGIDYMFNANQIFNVSVGYSKRSASLLERYVERLDVGMDGYEYLGNPGLSSEANLEVDASWQLKTEDFDLSVSSFYSKLTDFISAQTPALMSLANIKQFYNIPNARMFGGEIGSELRMPYCLSIGMQAAYTFAEDVTQSEPLPEIPPFELRMKLAHKNNLLGVAELIGRYAAAQNRVSERFSETKSPDFFVVDFYYKLQPRKAFFITAGVKNIFDASYFEHLNRMQLDGRRIYEPGRSFWINFTLEKRVSGD